MSDYKDRVKRAVLKFHEDDAIEIDKLSGVRKRRKNASPEKDLVAVPCYRWMKGLNWDVEIYEAKATFDPVRGIYRSQAMRAGVVDCQGVSVDGHAVFIEFKAPGKRGTFNVERNFAQKEYLLKKIQLMQFGCVVDSVELLKMYYYSWLDIVRGVGLGSGAPRQYLMDMLP